jgi:hypothetical protein
MTLHLAIPTMGWIATGLGEWVFKNTERFGRVTFYTKERPVAFARNKIVREFLESRRGNVLMMVDHDTIPPEHAIVQMLSLIEHGADVVTGITPIVRNDGTTYPNVFRAHDEVERPNTFAMLPKEPFEVVGCGASCLMVTRDILSKLPDPKFKTIEHDNGKFTAEDLYFCDQVRAVDGTIVAHSEVRCTHVKEIVV